MRQKNEIIIHIYKNNNTYYLIYFSQVARIAKKIEFHIY